MRQCLPFPVPVPRRSPALREPKPRQVASRLARITLVVACTGLATAAQLAAQNRGALQVSARVVSVQPSQAALKEAFGRPDSTTGASLVQITRSVLPSDDPLEKVRRARAIVTIAFVRN